MKPQKITISLAPVVSKAGSLTIQNEKSMAQAVSILSQLNRERDRIVADKEKLTKPLNETLKEIRGRYKPFEAKLDEAITYVRGQMSVYQTLLTEKAQKDSEAIALRIGDGFSVEEAITELAEIETAQGRVDTANGSVSFKTVQQFELQDITQVPHEYLLLDDQKVKNALKNGIILPGIRYFSVQIPINRR